MRHGYEPLAVIGGLVESQPADAPCLTAAITQKPMDAEQSALAAQLAARSTLDHPAQLVRQAE